MARLSQKKEGRCVSYTKTWKSHEEQLAQLVDRGMQLGDQPKAINYLKRIGYYRLSGYWYAFRKRAPADSAEVRSSRRTPPVLLDEFRDGASFQNAVDLYVFDKKLRFMVLDALERIEVALRVDLSHTLGALDRFAYLKPELFHENFSFRLDSRSGVTKHHQWLSKHAQLINRSKEDFVVHNRDKYGLPLVIWVACEVWDFGALSHLFSGMRESEQDAIAKRYGVHNGRVFATWLRSLNYLRNVCAHHSRLWNRNIVDQAKLPSATQLSWVAPFEGNALLRSRCFLLLRITRHLLHVIHPTSSWPERVKTQLQQFPDLEHLGLNLRGMGVPEGWEVSW